MENLIEKRVGPLLKCLLVLLFVFTAKVLTSSPFDDHDSHYEIYRSKPPYVRTFIKYHHRRTTDWNTMDEWPYVHDQATKRVQKRDVNFQSSTDFALNSIGTSNQFKKSNIKTFIEATAGPRISCLYKINSVSLSVTPVYDEEQNMQQVVENDHFEAPGPLSETTLPNGETVQVEQCTDSRASCYTLLQQDPDGNVTVLGQGCWRSSQNSGAYSCDLCTPVTPKLPYTKFCCCTKNYCNADFMSLKDYVATPKAELTRGGDTQHTYYSQIAASCVGVLAVLVLGFVISTFYCKKHKQEISEGAALDHVESLGDSESFATGLLCVDNLTLIEHINQGKFGSVWRGRLGSNPVAVKLYANGSTWQKEVAIYTMPYLTHPNILKYYGCDSRPSLTDSSSRHLIVLELCKCTLRERLIEKPLTWMEFAEYAHGIASALASLHNQGVNKPCIVHRDVNSNNILVSWDGMPKLGDLGLAQVVQPRSAQPAPRRIQEAGTLRYLAPEALEGALDLSGARAALCAVDVFAMGLVLWEMLWRTNGAHGAHTPPYSPPYALLGLHTPTLQQLQSLVSRNKMRPPLPRGPAFDNRVLRIAADTCDECWDHDAEARLTAVCVEERMSELMQMLSTPPPVDESNLRHDADGTTDLSTREPEKPLNSPPKSDIHTPLLYTYIGRDACTERNSAVEFKHKKAVKDTKEKKKKVEKLKNVSDTCFSVARLSPTNVFPDTERLTENDKNDIDVISNDINAIEVESREVKMEKPKWGIRRFFERKLSRCSKPLETEVTMNSDLNNCIIKTSVINEINYRPSNLVLSADDAFYEGPCTLSPPNRTLSPTMLIESELNKNEKVFGFKELAKEESGGHNQIFAVIVPKINTDFRDGVIELHRTNDSMDKDLCLNSCVSSSASDDSILKKSISNLPNNAGSSRASINLELQYMNSNGHDNSDCSSSEDDHLLLLSENNELKITMQSVQKFESDKLNSDVLQETNSKEAMNAPKYRNFDNEFSDSNDKENQAFSGDNPVYLAAVNGEMMFRADEQGTPKRSLKNLIIRQHSLEQVSAIFSSSGDVHLQNPAGRVKTPGDLPVAVRKARRDKLQRGRSNECNRLSLYDDRMMFGNSL